MSSADDQPWPDNQGRLHENQHLFIWASIRRIDDLVVGTKTAGLRLDHKPGGCDCSDEEEEGAGGEPIKAVSEENLLPETTAAVASQRYSGTKYHTSSLLVNQNERQIHTANKLK